jgi:hypothetical protein
MSLRRRREFFRHPVPVGKISAAEFRIALANDHPQGLIVDGQASEFISRIYSETDDFGVNACRSMGPDATPEYQFREASDLPQEGVFFLLDIPSHHNKLIFLMKHTVSPEPSEQADDLKRAKEDALNLLSAPVHASITGFVHRVSRWLWPWK